VNQREWQQDPLVRTVLEDRARRLARLEADAQELVGEELLTFRLGEGGYSLPTRAVREIAPLRSYTPLPAMPEAVVGLTNLRGRLLALLDLRPLLGIPRTGVRPDSLLLRLGLDQIEMGLLIDTVVAVRRSGALVAPALSAQAGQGLAWVRGVDQHLNLLLDLALLLADPRVAVCATRELLRSEP